MAKLQSPFSRSTIRRLMPVLALTAEMVRDADYVFGMTHSHTDSLVMLFPQAVEKIFLLREFDDTLESYEKDIADPIGGSYHLEHLTDELEAKAKEYLKRIDELGGMVKAIEQGYPQQEIQSAAYATQRAMEKGDEVVVGVNKFTAQEAKPEGLLRIDERVEREQVAALKQLRQTRDNAAAQKAVDAVRRAAEAKGENLIPLILEAVKAEATLGEISDAMRAVFGEHHEQLVL